jgi:integrase
MPKLSSTRITDKTVKNAKPREKTYDIRDAVLRGFMLKVQPSGSKAFYAEWGRGKRSRIGDAALITLERARDIAEQRLAAAKRGEVPRPQIRNQIPTLKQFLDSKYEAWALTHQKAGATNVQRIKGAFPEYMNNPMDQFTAWSFEQWKNKRKSNGIKPATINRDLTMLRAALNKAVEWNELKSNPLVSVKPLKGADDKRVRYLSSEEEKRLLGALKSREVDIRQGTSSSANKFVSTYKEGAYADHLQPMALVAMNTGLRFGELSQMRWTDIRLTDAPLITVQAAYAKTGNTRHIQLNKAAKAALQSWKAQQTDISGYVFATQSGERIKGVRKEWMAVLSAAKIKDFRWHDLRHDFASKLVMAGVDLNTVRELLGHSSLDMTIRYAHLGPAHKAAAVAQLDK